MVAAGKDPNYQQLLAEIRSIGEKIDSGVTARGQGASPDHTTVSRIEEILYMNDFTPSYRKNILDRIRKEFSLEELDDFDAVQDWVVEWIGESIKIHREECKNVMDLKRRYPYRMVNAQWTNEGAASYQAVLNIVGNARANMTTKVLEAISKDVRVTLRSLSVNSNEEVFDGKITVLVPNTDHLSQLISRLKRIQGVSRVTRHDSVKEP
jgi:hypothetical protein